MGKLDIPFDRNDLIIPEVIIEEFGLDPYRVMSPIFDTFGIAGGFEHDFNNDKEGNWTKS